MKLSDSVAVLPLVGPKLSSNLEKLGIITVENLLYHVPFRYNDYSNIVNVSQVFVGQTVTISAQITKLESIYTKNRMNLLKLEVGDTTGSISIVYFNQPFLAKIFLVGSTFHFSGKVEDYHGKLTLISPDYEENKNASRCIHTNRLVPVYSETNKISSKWLRTRIYLLLALLESGQLEINDYLLDSIKNGCQLLDIKKAIKLIHFPQTLEDVEAANKRLGFDELFETTLRSKLTRMEVKSKNPKIVVDLDKSQKIAKQFISTLPFTLTPTQLSSAEEIIKDMSVKVPMNRLLQGDVGSGKTIVAIIASLVVTENRGKVVVMVPTETLANQHYETFSKFLSKIGIKISLLTSGSKNYDEESDILIGTHALLFNESKFSPSLVIIDEQHKFGVAQRTRIVNNCHNKPKSPHLLTMTATPIPRSLSLTLLGDLDMSIISDVISGRKEIKTWYVPKFKREPAYKWLSDQVVKHKTQAIIICPLIEESQSESLKSIKSATVEFEKLTHIFPHFKLGLLHGRLKSNEKSLVLNDFRENKIQILVSTAVVEVGMDIPNATIIVIEGAERFGLASLHQFRGRVGRSNKQSYCLLFTESESESTVSRLKKFENIKSGLELAELDLKRRGSGEIFGLLQSGTIYFKVADLSNIELVENATSAVSKLLSNPLQKNYLEELKKIFANKWSKIDLN